jgi:uncharacterized membrane protein YidH (DUF202 family)
MTLFDPGLQPERTELAWRRTALALAVGSLIALRILPVAFGNPWWVLAGVAGLVVTGTLFLGARRRYRTVSDTLIRDGERAAMPGARILLALSLFVMAVGVVGVMVVVAIATGGGG